MGRLTKLCCVIKNQRLPQTGRPGHGASAVNAPRTGRPGHGASAVNAPRTGRPGHGASAVNAPRTGCPGHRASAVNTSQASLVFTQWSPWEIMAPKLVDKQKMHFWENLSYQGNPKTEALGTLSPVWPFREEASWSVRPHLV
ncbi:hypothetical protein P7K49_026110, partial [Saguinus oedipus]